MFVANRSQFPLVTVFCFRPTRLAANSPGVSLPLTMSLAAQSLETHAAGCRADLHEVKPNRMNTCVVSAPKWHRMNTYAIAPFSTPLE